MWEIALEGALPEKYLQTEPLPRAPSDIHLSEIVRFVNGTLATFADSDQLRSLLASEVTHRALYQVFLDVRDATATILENTTVADLVTLSRSTNLHVPRRAEHHPKQERKEA